MAQVTRRHFVQGATALGAAGAASSWPLAGIRNARAAETIVGVNWGGPWLEGAKPIARAWEQETGNRIAWELHEGSSAAIATKIRATWPTVKYDVIHGNDPVIHVMINEGWLESVDDVPNMKEIPAEFVVRDPEGRAMAVPSFASTVAWGYRTDMVEEPINSLEDLLDPSFRGKVGLRSPASWSGLPMVSMALAFGGDEQNLEPAFDFLKELAKAGNVANVAKSGVDVINSMNLGESSVTFAPVPEWLKIMENHPVQLLNRVEGQTAFKAFYTLGHWIIPKNTKVATGKDFANYFARADNNEAYTAAFGAAPVNVNASPKPELAQFFHSPDEMAEYAYFCDWKYMSEHDQEWIERFDLEVVPLMRG